jgi:hypothetical protein
VGEQQWKVAAMIAARRSLGGSGAARPLRASLSAPDVVGEFLEPRSAFYMSENSLTPDYLVTNTGMSASRTTAGDRWDEQLAEPAPIMGADHDDVGLMMMGCVMMAVAGSPTSPTTCGLGMSASSATSWATWIAASIGAASASDAIVSASDAIRCSDFGRDPS